jgi:hypothetical protein
MSGMTEKQQIVKRALCELGKHHKTICKFFAAVSEPLQIRKGEITKINLWKILLIDVQSRSGRKLNEDDIIELRERFFNDLDLQKAKALKDEERFDYLYNIIVGLPRIGPKIASVFMKNLVCKFAIFPELKDNLFLPIDVHIKNVLVTRLRVLGENEIRTGNPLTSKRSISMRCQEQLSRIHDPRVELDDFWYIGHLFCNKRSGLVCEQLCWIREYCRQKYKTDRSRNCHRGRYK